jgi:hypothetical protein
VIRPLPPRVLGPLSVLSRRVNVVGVNAGAEVTVEANGRVVGQATAGGVHQPLGLTLGGEAFAVVDLNTSLNGGERVTAYQGAPPFAGPPSEPVYVVGAPNALFPPQPVFVPVVGAEALLVRRLFPGATLTVRIDRGGNQFTDSVDASDWEQVLRLPTSLREGDALTISQAFGTGGVASWHAPGPIGWYGWGAGEDRLPTPVFDLPPQACDRGVLLGGMVPGATAVVEVNGVEHRQMTVTNHANVPVDSYVFAHAGDKGLEQGAHLAVWQTFPPTGQATPPNARLTGVVAPAQRPPAPPTITTYLCRESSELQVTGYRPGATLRVYIAAPGSTNFVLQPELTERAPLRTPATVPLLHRVAVGSFVAVTQEPCAGTESDRSTAIPVLDMSVSAGKPSLVEPILQCSSGVIAKRLTPGSHASIWSHVCGGPVTPDRLTDSVLPQWFDALIFEHDALRVVQHGGCIDPSSKRSAEVQVVYSQTLKPELDYLFTGDHVVGVWCTARTEDGQTVPAIGALVDIFVTEGNDTVWAGTGHTSFGGYANIQLLGFPIDTFAGVTARSTLCGDPISSGAPAYPVGPPHGPAKPTLINPADGSASDEQRPHFKWSDPGAGTAYEALHYHFTLVDDSTNTTLIPGLLALGTGCRIDPQHLEPGHSYHWLVVANGRRGDSAPATAKFKVNEKAKQEPPQPQKPPGWSKLLIWNCNQNWNTHPNTNGTVQMYVADKTTAAAWHYVQDIPAGYNSNGACGPGINSPVEFALDDGHLYDFAFLDADLPGCDASDVNNASCWKQTLMNLYGDAKGPPHTLNIL